MRQPNVVLIMSDQHNPHVLGCEGNGIVRTPNLDRLASDGILLQRNYCAGPLCVPSRMTFITGQYPLDLGIWTNAGRLPTDTPTFAHALNAAGYDTVLCGRMHFVGPDQNHGFKQRLVGDVSGAMTREQPGEMFEGVWSKHGCGQGQESLLPDAVGPGKATYEIYDEAVTERTCQWLAERGTSGSEHPFCLVVGLLLPHNPYVCNRDLFEEYMDKLPPEEDWELPGEHAAVKAMKNTRGAEKVTPENARRARAAYYGLVTTLDRNIGAMMDALKASGLDENTIAYTSDHGELCGEHGLWWKDSFYEGSVRVPMIWSCPGTVVQGVTSQTVTSLLDISATLTDLAGAPDLPNGRGRSLVELLRTGRPSENWPDEAFAETCAIGQRPARMIVRGNWKLNAYHGYEGVQLFDLDADPEERNDLAASPAYAEVRNQLEARLRKEWNGASVEARLQARLEEQNLVYGRGSAGASPISERWTFPTGQNTRD